MDVYRRIRTNEQQEKWDLYELLKHLEVTEWVLNDMPNLSLETLDLDGCGLDNIPSAILEIEYYYFRIITAVSLNHNPNITEADMLGKLEDLKAINMWGCGLSKIPNSWGQLHKLQVLGLGGMPGLTGFAPMKKLTNVRWLDLGYCGLTSIPDEITHLAKLAVLALGGNEGIVIDDSLCCFWNLRTLALNDCGLKEVPLPVFSLINLTHLHLDDNCLSTLGQEIVQLKELQEISVTGNDNLCFPKLLSQCDKVKRVIVDEKLNLTNVSHSLRRKIMITRKAFGKHLEVAGD